MNRNKIYDYELKLRLRMDKLCLKQVEYDKEKSNNIIKVKDKLFSLLINKLDYYLQKKIFIYAMKNYWKDHLVNKPLLSLSDKYNMYLNKERSKNLLKNVHFLHLDFNMKPGYKNYISGWQCNFCINYPKEEKDYEYNRIKDGGDPYFNCRAIYNYSENFLPFNWFTEDIDDDKLTSMPPFDFFKGSYYNPIECCPHDTPLTFNEFIK